MASTYLHTEKRIAEVFEQCVFDKIEFTEIGDGVPAMGHVTICGSDNGPHFSGPFELMRQYWERHYGAR